MKNSHVLRRLFSLAGGALRLFLGLVGAVLAAVLAMNAFVRDQVDR